MAEAAPELDTGWRQWIATNLERGCTRQGMFDILTAHGFAPGPVSEALEHEPEPCPPTFIPHGVRQPVSGLELYSLERFLSDGECLRLIQLVRPYLRRSTTTNEVGPYRDYRTSKTCDLGLLDDPLAREVDQRICKTLGIAASYGETIQAQWYDVGEEFKPHTDTFEPSHPGFEQDVGGRGQRTWTFMVFLNDVSEGGETHFTRAGVRFRPRRGQALIWNNLLPDGTPNPLTTHWGRPVGAGFKVILTKWFRTQGEGTRHPREPNERLRPLTQRGFLRLPTPPALQAALQADLAATEPQPEEVSGFIGGPEARPSVLFPLSDARKVEVHQALQELAEAWVGRYLEPTYVYGIRRYHRGTSLACHRDRLATHVVSAILNVDQETDEPWPLEIDDHFYRRHRLRLSPGQLLLYEGGRLLHGRPSPLRGERFDNVFVHYRLREEA